MNKTQELIVQKTHLNKNGKLKLLKIKNHIRETAGNLKDHVSSIIRDLYIVECEKLYYFDNCSSMRAFINKNKFQEMLSVRYETITRKLLVERFIDRNELDDEEIREIPSTKMSLIAMNKITDKDKIKDLSKYTTKEIEKRLHSRSQFSGRFIKNNFRRRNSTKIVNRKLEVPLNTSKKFLRSLNDLCKMYDVVMM